jgi:hypothetical protein
VDKQPKTSGNEIEDVYGKMPLEQVNEIYNRGEMAKEFKESIYGGMILEQLNLWIELADEAKLNSRLYNYEMHKEDGRKLYISALCDEVRRDTIHDIIETIEQDIRMGGYAEKEKIKRVKI